MFDILAVIASAKSYPVLAHKRPAQLSKFMSGKREHAMLVFSSATVKQVCWSGNRHLAMSAES